MADKVKKFLELHNSVTGGNSGNTSVTQKAPAQNTTNSGSGYKKQQKMAQFQAMHNQAKRTFSITGRNDGSDDFVFSFLRDSQDYIRESSDALGRLNWKDVMDTGKDETRAMVWENLRERKSQVRSFMEANRDTIDPDKYQQVMSYLDDFDTDLSSISTAYKNNRDYFAQWDSQKSYDDYLTYQRDLEQKKNLDLDAYSREIAALEQQLENYDPQIDWTDTNQRKQYDAGLKELEDEINRRKQYLTQAQRVQDQEAGTERYSQVTQNADFAAKSGFDSNRQDIGYQYVNADEAGRLDLEQKYGQYAAQFADRGYDSLTDEEKAIYNYYMNTGDRESAAEYLRYVEEYVQTRKGTETDAYVDNLVEENPNAKILRYAFMANMGLDQHKTSMQDFGHMISGKDAYLPANATQYAGALMREDMGEDGKKLPEWLGGGSTGQMVGDMISTSANMAPSILASTVVGLLNPGAGAAVGKGMMSAGAAGSGYRELINEGYTKEQARLYGLGLGAAEYFMESALGGISKLGGLPAKAIAKWAANVDNAILKLALRLGGSSVSEGLEEGLQEVISGWLKSKITHEDFYAEPADVMYSSLLGMATGVLFEAPSAIGSAANNRNAAADNLNSDIDNTKRTLATENGALTTELATHEKSSEVGDKKATTAKATVSKTETIQYTSDIDSFSRQFGDQAESVKRNYLLGLEMNPREDQELALREYEVGFHAAFLIGKAGKKEALTSENVHYLSQSQREIAYQMGVEAAAAARAAEPRKAVTTARITAEDGSLGDTVNVAEIVSMDDNNMTFRLEDGRTVTDDDLSFDKGQKVLATVWELGIDVKSANTILTESAANTADEAAQAAGIEEAYRYGAHGYSMKQLKERGIDAGALTDGQRQAAWKAGQIYRQQAAVTAPQTAAAVTGKGAGIYFDAGSGNVTAFSEEAMKGLTEKRKAGVQAAVVLQKLGIGQSYHFFESYVNEADDRVYKDTNGVERTAVNGWYDRNDGSIHIDLNAGSGGEGLTLYTLSHELTHFVEQWSKPKYQALADFLVESYGKGMSVDQLVISKQAQLSESRGTEVSYEEAYSEFIADSMEAMLSDGNVLEKLTELKARDKSLFDKMQEFFRNLAKKIREIYKELTPDSAEGKAVLEMKDQIEQIQQLFAEGLVDAGENFQAAADIGLEVDMETESVSPTVLYSERTWRESDYVQEHQGRQFSDRKKVSGFKDYDITSAVYEIRNEKAERGHDLMKIGTMPALYHELFGLDGDVYVSNSHLYQNMVSRTVAEAEGRFNLKDHADYHDLGEEKIINAIEQFQDPLLLMESLKDFNEPRLVALLDEKGNDGQNLIAVLELYSPIRAYGSPNMRSHVLMTIYEKNSLPDYIEKTVDKGRILYKKQGLHQLRQADLQLVGDVTEETLKKNVARFNKKVKAFKEQHNISYQDRSTGTSNRALLAGAFEELVTSPDELKFIRQYQENIELLNKQEAKLQELRGQIREISFGKGERDTRKLKQLQEKATKTANRIDIYDRKLLKLERAKPLRDVLEREREKIRKATRQKGLEAMEAYREKRKDSAAKKDARRKIRKTIMELDKLLNRGDKKKNVKDGMSEMVSKSLKLAEALFMDEYSNRDMLRNGVGIQMTDAEEATFREAYALLQKIESDSALAGKEFGSEIEAMEYLRKLDGQLSGKMAKLKDVFARERKRLYGTTVSDLLGQLADEYNRLSEAEDGAVRAAKDENVYAHLLQLQKDVGGTTVRDMSLSQMEQVADAYTMVLTTVRNANKMFAKNLKFKRDTLAGMVMGEIGAAAKKISKLVSPGKDAADRFSWNNLKPIYAFERLGSQTLKTLFGNIRKGQDVWAVDMQEADAFRREQYRKHKRKDWDLEKQHSFEFESGKVQLSLEQIMSLYAYSRREQALDHLLKGGFVFGGSTEVIVRKNGIKRRYLKKDATAYNLSADELTQVIETLNAEQKAFVEEMQTYLSDVMGGKGNEISLQMYGIKSFGEKNYFPIRSAGQYMEKAKEDSFRKEQGQISIVNSGFTKAVAPKANNPITLDGFMDVWSEHVNDMAMYHGFVLPMEDFRRVYNYSTPNVEEGNSQSVNAAIENAFGKAATGYIDQLYKDLNGGAVSDNRENLFRKLVGLHKKAAVFASASVVIQQPSAFVRAFALVDMKHFIGPKVNPQRHKQLWAELKKYAPVAFVKEMDYFDTGMGRSARDYLQAEEYSGIREKTGALIKDADYRDELLGKAPALADEMTWCMIWEAVKRETKARNPGMSATSDSFLKIAGERFAEVIDKTQVYDSVLSRSANMRSRAEYMNMLTSFMAEPTTSINMLEDALRKGDRKQIKRTVGAVYGSVVLNALLVSLVYAARDDDEDETYWEKYLGSVAVEVLDGINPITYYPFLRDIWSIGQGYDVERADMSLITDFSNAAKNVISAGQKLQEAAEDEEAAAMEKFKDALWGMVDSMASLTGLPVKNIRRDIEGAQSMYKTISKDLAGRKTTDLSLQDAVLADVMNAIPIGNLLYSKSKRDRLYGALVAGDTAYIQRLRAGYGSDNAYHSAIRLALRDHDSRIWEAAIAWNANEMKTYMNILTEIIGEKHFIQDDIVMAIRNEASSMEESESTSSSKVKGYFTNEKFGVAMGQNNVSMADTIRKDLIDTAVANGKTREEAEKTVQSTARSQLKQLYADGTITGMNAEKMLVKYGGYDRDDAADKVAEWKYEKDFPELDGRITYSQYKRWETDGKSRGIDLDTFTDVAEYRGGNTSAGVRSQDDVAAYINSMPISTALKDALWCCFWSESTLYKNAPWH